jgi:hypothetical protein
MPERIDDVPTNSLEAAVREPAWPTKVGLGPEGSYVARRSLSGE